MILIGWMIRVLSGAWMALAHTVGATVRAFGRNARDLDPAHRRDGVGLAALGLAILTAAAVWWHLGSVVGRGLSAVVRNGFGEAAWVMPLLLALLAWRYLRHPDRNADNARMVIGWTALLIGGLGLLHIAHGTPRPVDGTDAIRAAGGFIGYAVSAPLVSSVTAWVATPLLALVAGFGLLVTTGTPLHRVPARLAELHGFVRGRPPAGTEAEGAETGARLPRGSRKKQEAIEAGDHTRPYDSPLLGGTIRGGPARSGDAARPVAPGRRRRGQRGAGVQRPGRRGGAGGQGRGPRWTGRTQSLARARPGDKPAAPGGPRGAGQARAAHAHRGHRRELHAAARGAAAPGDGAEEPDPGQRPDGRGAAGRAGAVRGRRRGDRVHPRPDRDQVRDRAAARRSRWSGSPRCRRTSPTR